MSTEKKILLIDDEEVIIFGYTMILQEPGVRVDNAQTFEDARERIAALNYDVALVDLKLSHSTTLEGFDCIRLLRTMQRECRIIVITAFGDIETRRTAEILGADLFFEKPIDPEAVRKILTSFGIFDG